MKDNSFPESVDALWINGHLATMTGEAAYGTIQDGALATSGSKIAWVGEKRTLPGDVESRAGEVHDGEGGWITPGLIDCHTHLVYGGSRAREFGELMTQEMG